MDPSQRRCASSSRKAAREVSTLSSARRQRFEATCMTILKMHVRRAWLPIVMAVALATSASTNGPRFYPDDPLQREPEIRDASGAKPWDIGLIYELSMNLFVTAKRVPSNTRARNVNTIDEVPDSSWFTNRIGPHNTVRPEDLARGANVDKAPEP